MLLMANTKWFLKGKGSQPSKMQWPRKEVLETAKIIAQERYCHQDHHAPAL
jgi:hypothetical protein